MKRLFFSYFTLYFKVLWLKYTKFRDFMIELVAVKMLFPIAGMLQQKSPGQLEIEDLCNLPNGTFGHALGKHMQHYKIAFIPGFEEHDMKHLLLSYPLTVQGEMRLSAFEFGTGNRSFMTLGVFFPAFVLAPELWPVLKQDYQKGQKNKQVRSVHLKSWIHAPVAEVMKQLALKAA